MSESSSSVISVWGCKGPTATALSCRTVKKVTPALRTYFQVDRLKHAGLTAKNAPPIYTLRRMRWQNSGPFHFRLQVGHYIPHTAQAGETPKHKLAGTKLSGVDQLSAGLPPL